MTCALSLPRRDRETISFNSRVEKSSRALRALLTHKLDRTLVLDCVSHFPSFFGRPSGRTEETTTGDVAATTLRKIYRIRLASVVGSGTPRGAGRAVPIDGVGCAKWAGGAGGASRGRATRYTSDGQNTDCAVDAKEATVNMEMRKRMRGCQALWRGTEVRRHSICSIIETKFRRCGCSRRRHPPGKKDLYVSSRAVSCNPACISFVSTSISTPFRHKAPPEP